MEKMEKVPPIFYQALSGRSDGSGDASTTVSKFSVFGMFLTLVLCLLTQPFGNLLYSYSNNWFSKLMFLTWRFNPLICLIEAISICIILCSNVATLWKETSGLQAWRRNLQITAAALLLLRAKKMNHDGNLVLEELYYELVESEGARVAADSTRLPHATTVAQYGSTGVSRRTMATAEKGVISNEQPADVQTAVLEQALGTNALSHREFTIDIFTFTTIIFLAIKLVFIEMAWQIRFAAFCMISGWLVVQILLLLLHGGELSELDIHATVKTAWSLRYLIGMHNIKDLPRVNNMTIAIPVLVIAAGHLNYLLVSHAEGPEPWVSILLAVVWVLLAALFLYTRSRLFTLVPIIAALVALFDPTGYVIPVFGLSWSYILFSCFLTLIICYPMMISSAKASWLEVLCAGFNLYFTLLATAFMLIFYREAETSKPTWLDIFG